MKAIVFTRYGAPGGLVMKEVPKPVPRDNEILVRVRAATVTAGDTEIRRLSLPVWLRVPMRLYGGLLRPKRLSILGMEVAGEIVAVGSAVTRFSVGDEVFAPTGLGFGGYAQFVCLDSNQAIGRKPPGVAWCDAAPLSIGGLEALSFVRRAGIAPGDDVLVYGGSGSIGTYAVQLARHAGGHVTAVGNPSSLDLMRSLGAQTVLDYTREDFTRLSATYDVLIDAIGKCPFIRALRKLRAGGRCLLANPGLGEMIAGPAIALASRRKVIHGPSKELTEDLEYLGGLVDSGTLRTVIDRTYSLEQVAEAHGYVDAGDKTGNVVIDIGS